MSRLRRSEEGWRESTRNWRRRRLSRLDCAGAYWPLQAPLRHTTRRQVVLTSHGAARYSDRESGDFLFDWHPNYPSLFVAAGGSGHAFSASRRRVPVGDS